MKEHRTKALRVTTPHSIESGVVKDEFMGRENANDLFGTLRILQFEILPTSQQQQQQQQLLQQRQRSLCDDHDHGPAPAASSSASAWTASSSTRCTAADAMTVRTATITANSVFGKHDSFYRWFSQNEQSRQLEGASRDDRDRLDDTTSCVSCDESDNNGRGRNDIDKGGDNRVERISQTCHCRSSAFPNTNRKFATVRHKKSSTSSDGRHFSSPLAHSQHSDTLLTIVSGDLCENWFLKLRDIKEVIRRAKSGSHRNDWRESKDKFGNTALLVSGRRLLEEKQFDKAVELAKILLDEGADVNVINDDNRTLLSYSISCMDESIRLTTLLLNYGADVWSMGAVGELAAHPIDKTETNRGGRTATSCNNSAFAWFLRGVMRQLQFGDQCLRTFYVLAETMGENPAEMQRHAIATMLNHSKCYTIFGPLFYQIKQAMHPYWSQPRSLKYLSRSVIRKRISGAAGRFINEENVSSLKLPPPLRTYLMLES